MHDVDPLEQYFLGVEQLMIIDVLENLFHKNLLVKIVELSLIVHQLLEYSSFCFI
jgi:hypothetical protein